jgi:hypothetical protein
VLKDSLRTAVGALQAKLVSMDAHLVKAKHIADLGGARALCKLVQVGEVLDKVADTIREAIASAATPLFDQDDDKPGDKKK